MATVTGLHLQYRLWIADMNADIDVLRILDDYIAYKSTKNGDEKIATKTNDFKEVFLKLRKDMVDLRHLINLNKIHLSAMVNEPPSLIHAIKNSIHHKELKERYEMFKKSFIKTKKEFQHFENA